MTSAVQQFVASLGLAGPVLEVGSLDVNGSVRHLFQEYTGVDRRAGPNVSHIMNGHCLDFSDETFAAVLSLETLEHDESFWLTVPELRRVLTVGGRLVITVPGFGYPHHDYPSDYWRFSVQAVERWFEGMEQVSVTEKDRAIMAHGVKR